MILTNEEFNKLLQLEKIFTTQKIILPTIGTVDSFELTDVNNRIPFLLDIDRRGKIELSKYKIQNRYAVTEVLVRIDIDSPPHINPDGTKLSRNHIHIYREGFGDRWAYELKDLKDTNLFQNICTFRNVFNDFCKYCNISLDNKEIQDVI